MIEMISQVGVEGRSLRSLLEEDSKKRSSTVGVLGISSPSDEEALAFVRENATYTLEKIRKLVIETYNITLCSLSSPSTEYLLSIVKK